MLDILHYDIEIQKVILDINYKIILIYYEICTMK